MGKAPSSGCSSAKQWSKTHWDAVLAWNCAVFAHQTADISKHSKTLLACNFTFNVHHIGMLLYDFSHSLALLLVALPLMWLLLYSLICHSAYFVYHRCCIYRVGIQINDQVYVIYYWNFSSLVLVHSRAEYLHLPAYAWIFTYIPHLHALSSAAPTHREKFLKPTTVALSQLCFLILLYI